MNARRPATVADRILKSLVALTLASTFSACSMGPSEEDVAASAAAAADRATSRCESIVERRDFMWRIVLSHAIGIDVSREILRGEDANWTSVSLETGDLMLPTQGVVRVVEAVERGADVPLFSTWRLGDGEERNNPGEIFDPASHPELGLELHETSFFDAGLRDTGPIAVRIYYQPAAIGTGAAGDG